MPLARTIRSRGSTIVVEAHGEVMFLPSGDIGRWMRIFTDRIEKFTIAYAPSNKGWRWAHYGKALKKTFDGDVAYDPLRLRIYMAVGSSSDHALYVDQGTGVYGGNGPYQAKILPPYRPGSPSLYEHTWVPPGSHRSVTPVFIRGQKGQFFFDRGMKRAFQSMRMRSFQLPGEGASGMTKALTAVPDGLINSVTGVMNEGVFVQQLQEWRRWRDEHFRSGRTLGYNASARNRAGKINEMRRVRATEVAKSRAKATAAKPLPKKSAKSLTKPRRPTPADLKAKAIRDDRVRFVGRLVMRYPAASGYHIESIRRVDGRWTATVTRHGREIGRFRSSNKT